MDIRIYDFALRCRLRFASSRGYLSVEDLWEVPLRSKDDFNLDTIARECNKEVKELIEESFVDQERSEYNTSAETCFEIVKHVIAVKLEEEAGRLDSAKRSKHRERIMEALERKQEAALEDMSEDELKQRLAELEG